MRRKIADPLTSQFTVTFSVIIAVYNGAALVERAARSALAQSRPPAEVIVVDDGSTDQTADIVRAIPGVQLVSQRKQGVSTARNAGANVASGDWLVFLDHDDELIPDALETFHHSITSYPGHWVHYGSIFVERMAGGAPRISGSNASEGPIPAAALDNLFRVQIITPGGFVINRDFFHKIEGFDSRWTSVSEDQDLLIRAGLATQFKFCDHVVCHKHFHGGNITANWRTTTLGSYHCSLHHIRAIRASGKFPEFNHITESMVLDLAIRRAIKYQQENLLRDVLAAARADGASSFWSRLFRVSFRAGMAYRQLRHHLGHYFPTLHHRFNYGDLG